MEVGVVTGYSANLAAMAGMVVSAGRPKGVASISAKEV